MKALQNIIGALNHPDVVCVDTGEQWKPIRKIYFGTDSAKEIKMLFDYGTDFPLVNDIIHSINVASELGIQPVKPVWDLEAQ